MDRDKGGKKGKKGKKSGKKSGKKVRTRASLLVNLSVWDVNKLERPCSGNSFRFIKEITRSGS